MHIQCLHDCIIDIQFNRIQYKTPISVIIQTAFVVLNREREATSLSIEGLCSQGSLFPPNIDFQFTNI